jgi:putative ABC transport system substrate-binding protein
MRRIGLVLLAGSLILAPLTAGAEQPKTPPRIGFLLMGAPQAELTSAFDAFRVGLHELGWTENENIVIEYRWAGEVLIGFPSLRPTWSGSRSISLSRARRACVQPSTQPRAFPSSCVSQTMP